MNILRNRRLGVILSFVAFSISFLAGWTLWDQQTDQNRHYMLGRAAYLTTQYNLAVVYFDQADADYLQQKSDRRAALAGPLEAPASLELAELARHFKALSLVKIGDAPLAVEAFKQALSLTTEYALSHESLDPQTLKKILADRKVTQIDFEILFHQQEKLAKQEGKGKGNKKGDEEKQDPANGNQAGKGDRDAL